MDQNRDANGVPTGGSNDHNTRGILRFATYLIAPLVLYVLLFSFTVRVAFPMYLTSSHPRFEFYLYCPEAVATPAEILFWPVIRLFEAGGGRYWPDPIATGIRAPGDVPTLVGELVRQLRSEISLLGCLAFAVVAMRIRTLAERRRQRQLALNLCPCGYSLIGNVSGRCPECGRDTDDLRKTPG